MGIHQPIQLCAIILSILTIGCTQQVDTKSEPPDLILINADVYTVDPILPRAGAFAVKDGRFVAVGQTQDIEKLAGSETVIIDAHGHTVLPGLIDAHSHVSGNAPAVAGVDLSYVRDKSEWLRLIKEADARLPEGEWIIGGYWDHTLSDGRYPTKEMIDAVVADRPVFLNHIDGHYAWVNSLALALAGVTSETPVPPGGEIVVDAETGEPTGILLEGAMHLVRDVIPERSDVQRYAGLAEMQKYANSFGITGLHQMGDLEDYLHMVENGDPTLRIWYGDRWFDRQIESLEDAVAQTLNTKKDVAARVDGSGKTQAIGPLLSVGYVKLLNDGVLSAHTAVLIDDYTDRTGWKGEYIISPDDLKEQVQALTAAGMPVAIHSIGDAAVRASIDAFESARDNVVPFPNRIEHIEMVHLDDIQRFKDLGLAASMQPNHATNSIAYVPSRVGANREDRAYVWNSMLRAGVPLVYGADYPTSPLDPLVQMADAMFRESPFGLNDGQPWHPEEAVGFEDALMAYTQAGANLTSWRDEIGSISIGKWADFVLLDNIVPVPVDDSFRDISVDRTYLAGRVVYAKPPASE